MKAIRIISMVAMIICIGFGTILAQDNKKAKPKKTEEVTFIVSMSCDGCKQKVEKNISWEKGVKDMEVNLEKKTVKINYDPKKTTEKKLKKAIENLKFTCEKLQASAMIEDGNKVES